jgi:hypothetical protein
MKDWAAIAEAAWSAPGWREAAAEYHQQRGKRRAVVEIEPERLAKLRRLLDDSISIEHVWDELNKPTGAETATLQAAEYLVKQRDPKRLREWLRTHNEQERAQIVQHLENKGRGK